MNQNECVRYSISILLKKFYTMKKTLLTTFTILLAFCVNAQTQISLPITWDDSSTVNYNIVDFDGTSSSLVADPANTSNTVLKTEKSPTGQPWQGTILGDLGLASAIPFAQGSTTISAIIYSPDAGIPVMMKVEDASNGNIFVETTTMTTVANAWDTLVFDFSTPSNGTLNMSNTYDKLVIFYDFMTLPTAAKTYYVDNVFFGGAGSPPPPPPTKAQINLPINWDDTANVDYTVTDFDGTASMLAADPNNANNIVLKTDKSPTGQPWQGTTLSTPTGLASPIPFSGSMTTITAIVYSPDAGIPVRLKVEDSNNGNVAAETEATTTVANAWDTLTFDFTNPAAGTAALDTMQVYDKATIFYDFFTNPAATKTYYVDAVYFGSNSTPPPPPVKDTVEITINVNMALVGGADSSGVFLAGGTSFGTPGTNQLLDPDGDGIYSIVVKREKGFSSHYTFTNGNCPNYSCKENIAGLPCADPGNFNDRFMPAVMNDTTISTCFGACSTDGTCPSPPDTSDITFSVDMNEYGSSFTEVQINGTFNNWCGSCDPMDDTDGDNVWEITMRLAPGTYEYKFTYDNWSGQETLDPTTDDSTCTKTTGTFTNRIITVTADYSTPVFCWESCNACASSSVNEIGTEIVVNIFANNAENNIQITGYDKENTTVQIFNMIGQNVLTQTQLTGSLSKIDMSKVNSGIYIVSVKSNNEIITKKVFID